MEKKFSVDICGEEYPIKGDIDRDYMTMLAATVDARMRDLIKKNQYLPPQKVGALTALYFADDYFKLKKDYTDLLNLINAVDSDGNAE